MRGPLHESEESLNILRNLTYHDDRHAFSVDKLYSRLKPGIVRRTRVVCKFVHGLRILLSVIIRNLMIFFIGMNQKSKLSSLLNLTLMPKSEKSQSSHCENKNSATANAIPNQKLIRSVGFDSGFGSASGHLKKIIRVLLVWKEPSVWRPRSVTSHRRFLCFVVCYVCYLVTSLSVVTGSHWCKGPRFSASCQFGNLVGQTKKCKTKR